jgi:hypothetical protein
MRRLLQITSIFVTLALSPVGTIEARAQQIQGQSYQAMSDRFFAIVQEGKPSDAIEYLLSTNPAMKKIPDQTEQLKAQFASAVTLLGPYISHTMLVETKVSGMFVYQHYFVAYERQPISIRISYYKPGTSWICYSVQFDANLPGDIQTAADGKLPLDVK